MLSVPVSIIHDAPRPPVTRYRIRRHIHEHLATMGGHLHYRSHDPSSLVASGTLLQYPLPSRSPAF